MHKNPGERYLTGARNIIQGQQVTQTLHRGGSSHLPLNPSPATMSQLLQLKLLVQISENFQKTVSKSDI